MAGRRASAATGHSRSPECPLPFPEAPRLTSGSGPRTCGHSQFPYRPRARHTLTSQRRLAPDSKKQLTLTLSIRADGTVFLDKEQLPFENLGETLRQRAAAHRETGVLLFADKDLPYQKLYDVLDLIRLSGLSQVSLQAEVR